ncbi:HSF-DOMAIN domain-containing protein [Mycena kentingensis (nom. inval.)]|nr:HSF-DOMAIN domain-containing protein [Mycena kentingensis (nom. inval.)]
MRVFEIPAHPHLDRDTPIESLETVAKTQAPARSHESEAAGASDPLTTPFAMHSKDSRGKIREASDSASAMPLGLSRDDGLQEQQQRVHWPPSHFTVTSPFYTDSEAHRSDLSIYEVPQAAPVALTATVHDADTANDRIIRVPPTFGLVEGAKQDGSRPEDDANADIQLPNVCDNQQSMESKAAEQQQAALGVGQFNDVNLSAAHLDPPTFGAIAVEVTSPAALSNATDPTTPLSSALEYDESENAPQGVPMEVEIASLGSAMTTATDNHASSPPAAEVPENVILAREFNAMPGFLRRLFQVANDPANKDIIRWNPTGDIIVLVDLVKAGTLGLSTADDGHQYQGQFKSHGFHRVRVYSKGTGKGLLGWKHPVINRRYPHEKLDSLSAEDAMHLGGMKVL